MVFLLTCDEGAIYAIPKRPKEGVVLVAPAATMPSSVMVIMLGEIKWTSPSAALRTIVSSEGGTCNGCLAYKKGMNMSDETIERLYIY